MTAYNKIVDYAAKDALLTGNPAKIVKGVEIGAEFDSIAAADATNIKTDGTHAATSKVTPVDADELPLVDSAASWGLKRLTWANLKATILTWLQGTVFPSPGFGKQRSVSLLPHLYERQHDPVQLEDCQL